MAYIEAQDSEDEYWEEEEDTLRDKFLTFNIGEECYGLELKYVTEIIGIQKITRLPEMPEFIKGVINLRGRVVPVIDARIRFHLLEKEYGDRTCIIVIEIESSSFGLIVDTVDEVLCIQEDWIDPPPQSSTLRNKFIKGIGKVGENVIILIDADKFLTDKEINEITLLS
ncbi:MAG: chemotaxis protein CheW [Chloroflexota bacterium]